MAPSMHGVEKMFIRPKRTQRTVLGTLMRGVIYTLEPKDPKTAAVLYRKKGRDKVLSAAYEELSAKQVKALQKSGQVVDAPVDDD